MHYFPKNPRTKISSSIRNASYILLIRSLKGGSLNDDTLKEYIEGDIKAYNKKNDKHLDFYELNFDNAKEFYKLNET